MLEHGGRLRRAAQTYGIPLDRWLDLSTGITPHAWPMVDIPASAWHRLPEDDDGLVEAARDYYGAPDLLPVAGSQAAIQVLPHLRAPSRVGVIAPGYLEHAHAWTQAGHDVVRADAESLFDTTAAWDVIVLIHPNNPGGEHFAPARLLELHGSLAQRGGWLVVDEAFIDPTPERSIAAHTDREGLIVLRSIGKFFGLAGARAGFLCASPALLREAQHRLGPWTLSGPSRHAVRAALADRAWQASARAHLAMLSARLDASLERHGLGPTVGCALFRACRVDDASRVHHALAQRAILTRLFDDPPRLRFGLPGNDEAFDRLDRALGEVMHDC